jgi:predicted nucleic acid-binding protein
MPLSKILVDSSFLIALYDQDSDVYREARELARLYRGQFLVPQVALTEVVYLLKREAGVQGAVEFLEEFNQSQPDLQDITVDDLKRVQAIMDQFASARFDFVDCCIMALSERLNVTQVCTLDRRDFSIFRPKHCDYLEILP